jgi:hypothetical protein
MTTSYRGRSCEGLTLATLASRFEPSFEGQGNLLFTDLHIESGCFLKHELSIQSKSKYSKDVHSYAFQRNSLQRKSTIMKAVVWNGDHHELVTNHPHP